MPPRKRKGALDPDAGRRLKEVIGTPGASDRAVCSIWNKAVKDPEDKVKSSTFKSYVQKSLAPALSCYDRFELQAVEGETVEIYIANIEKLILYLGTQMPGLADLLRVPLRQGAVLQPIIYHDEAIASNPLSTEKLMKSMMVYYSWKELKRSLFMEDCWLPVCCVQHADTDKLHSGFNGVMSLLVEHLLQPRWEIGFAVVLLLGLLICVVINSFPPKEYDTGLAVWPL